MFVTRGFIHRVCITTIALFFGAWQTYGQSSASRNLILTYTCYLTNLPPKAKQADCWIPVPISNDRQTVEILAVDLINGRINSESKYGNQIYFRHFILDPKNIADTLTIMLRYKVTLNEKSVSEAKQLSLLPGDHMSADMQIYLGPNNLIPLQGPTAVLHQQLKLPAEPIPAARKIYDYLIDSMVYNYQAPGAGHGDAVWACSRRTGDCTDYHSVFIGICRSAGIPADHVFGLPLKIKQGKGEVNDWHCWARFWVEGPGWITIDASEAAKHPELRDYNFGTLSNTYITLSHGRDVVLEPVQQGPALNIFAAPYVEVDGNDFKNIKWTGVFQEESQNR
jgi:Transglutaminase-like superfamily